MAIPYRDLLGSYDPTLSMACCRSKCPQPVYIVGTVPPVTPTASPVSTSTMKGMGGRRMGYLRGIGETPATAQSGSEYFTVDPSIAPKASGNYLTMEDLALLPQAQLTPQDQLFAAQGQRRRVATRVPPGNGSMPFEMEKHGRPAATTGGFQYTPLALVGERF